METLDDKVRNLKRLEDFKNYRFMTSKEFISQYGYDAFKAFFNRRYSSAYLLLGKEVKPGKISKIYDFHFDYVCCSKILSIPKGALTKKGLFIDYNDLLI